MSSAPAANRLAEETSPYLLQHAHNPVDWYPWGAEALERARREDRPILLSIGYAACHWCHVMERESFEDDTIAAFMNEHFVCIKVDREERPDVDDIYMTAVQMMTGHGGWPLTVFITPDLQPFWGGTYFPPRDRAGMPGFMTVLRSLAESWKTQRSRIESLSGDLAERLRAQPETDGREPLDSSPLAAAARRLGERFDARWGGFSGPPKFPQSSAISLLLRVHHRQGDDRARHMAVFTLEKMARGGIYDHVGGGFHRYSTDARWLVPHFEKMLYDNALLADACLEAVQLTGSHELETAARETLDWVLREMQDPEGGYRSTLDADSEGEEGRYYVWSLEEVQEALGDDAGAFCAAYDVTAAGNWEGKNILHRAGDPAEIAAGEGCDVHELQRRLDRCRATLRGLRDERVRPGLDDKVLTDWNGLMIHAMVSGYRVLGEDRFLESARTAAAFVLDAMVEGDRLLHAWRLGRARIPAYLDDHASMVRGLVALHETTSELRWLRAARRLADALLERFGAEGGGFHFTGAGDHDELIARPVSGHDGATPSGNSLAADALLELAVLTGEERYRERAVEVLHAFQSALRDLPTAFCQMLLALDRHLAPPREIAVVGDRDAEEVRRALGRLWRQYAPTDVVAVLDPDDERRAEIEEDVPLLSGKTALDGGPAFYVCERYACQAPTGDIEEVLQDRA